MLVITEVPVASRAAAISLSAEFLAPTTLTSPASLTPPVTRITSTSGIVGAGISRLLVMAVHLTRIYTRTGDAGTTALGNGERVAKTDPRIAAYAEVDECNAAIGVALAIGDLANDVSGILTTVQNDLFDVCADLCNPITPDPKYPPLRVTEEYVTRL